MNFNILIYTWIWPEDFLEDISRKGLPGSGGVHSYEPSVLTHPWPVGHAHEFQHSSISVTRLKIKDFKSHQLKDIHCTLRQEYKYNSQIRSISRGIFCRPLPWTRIWTMVNQITFLSLLQLFEDFFIYFNRITKGPFSIFSISKCKKPCQTSFWFTVRKTYLYNLLRFHRNHVYRNIQSHH